VWSRQRVARRVAYATWMGSRSWLAWRQRWLDKWLAVNGREPVCQACGRPWTLTNGDLHYRSYERLGWERWGDVVPLCRSCHEKLHALYESNPAWRRRGRAQATDMIIARLAHQQRAGLQGVR
jgi:hypothetical protein